MFNYFKECVTNKYADFNGRARRSEYWYFALVSIIISWTLSFVGAYLMIQSNTSIIYYLSVIFSLAILVPSIAVGIRRMHDVGKSGWYVLIPIYNLILACTDSQPGENAYGPNPKGIGNTGGNDEMISSIGTQ
jgi:uncharacterized membrane protein YhaH (DUF805 family)